MQTHEIRKRFLDHFVQAGHTEVPSASVILDDPNLLFVNAGMVQFVPYFLGQRTPPYPTATSIQKCIRTPDIDEVGITMITVINREYCKKLIVVLPGQQHPAQYHKVKEETFNLLHGALTLSLDGVSREHGAGSVAVVERGVVHAFTSASGAVIEEISSTHHGSDSYYVDEAINLTPSRKTFVTHWMD